MPLVVVAAAIRFDGSMSTGSYQGKTAKVSAKFCFCVTTSIGFATKSSVTNSSKMLVGMPTNLPRKRIRSGPQSSANQHHIFRPGPSRPIGLPDVSRGRRTTNVNAAGSPSCCDSLNEKILSSHRLCAFVNVVSVGSIHAKYGVPAVIMDHAVLPQAAKQFQHPIRRATCSKMLPSYQLSIYRQ